MSKNERRSQKDIFDDIIDVLIENEISEHATPRQYLEAKGVDVDSLVSDGMEQINRWRRKSRLKERRKQFESLRTRFNALLSQQVGEPIANLREKVVEIVSGGDEKVAMAFWHKLENIPDSDLQDMVNEQVLLQHLAEIYDDVEEE